MFRTMGRIQWRCREFPKNLLDKIKKRYEYLKLCFRSLTYNHHMNSGYASDVCLEPVFWFVDNFTQFLGPFFVACVIVLTSLIVYICYWIGLPFWWSKSPTATCFLVVFGNLILVNVVFHFYMAAKTSPGYPPEGELITEAVSICKKCIAPKPPRTHHCSVCSRCILKMDHHCPWLNNCVGHGNHRYFFLYMVFTTIGSIFIITFGMEIGFRTLWLGEGDGWVEPEPLQGHPVRFNLTGHIVPVTEMNEYGDRLSPIDHDLPMPTILEGSAAKYRAIIFAAIINVAVVFALGTLVTWHFRLINKGETSVESHINASETKRYATVNKIYVNPYNFGQRKNWRLFLGLVRGRTWWRHVLLPSSHKPEGNGLTWYTVHDNNFNDDDWP